MSLLRVTATMLTRQRSNEILRTIFAVAMYVFQVVSDFVPSVGASSSPSGGKIGPAMLLSWLVSVVLLSNAVGDLGPPATIEKIVSKFMKRIGLPMDIPEKECSTFQLKLFGIQWGVRQTSTTHEESLVWSGAVYCYRPNKGLNRSGWRLVLLSILPVMIAFGTAFTVLQAGPTFFSCRSIFVIVASGFWVLSVVLTYVLSRDCV